MTFYPLSVYCTPANFGLPCLVRNILGQESAMRSGTFPAIFSVIFSATAAACLRPQLDERAMQWSSEIVEARLVSIDPDVKLGDTQERRGPIGALGTATTSYFARVHRFDVTGSIQGTLKK